MLNSYFTTALPQSNVYISTRLSDLESKDKAKLARDHARNALESFVLETKDKMYSEEYERAASEEEKQNIVAKLNEGSEWLEYESDNAETKVSEAAPTALDVIINILMGVRGWEAFAQGITGTRHY